MRRIVVGVDGSAHSVEALRWAVDEARRRDTTLQVVSAWNYPTLTVFPLSPLPHPDDMAASAKQAIDTALEAVSDTDDVRLERSVVSGPAAQALIHASKDADLLVVGARGLGGFGGLLVGSVSQQCSHHAHCPVVIVHAHEAAAA